MPTLRTLQRWMSAALIFWVQLATSADRVTTDLPQIRTNSVSGVGEGDAYQPNPQDKFQFGIEEDPNKGGELEIRNVSALYDLQFSASRGTDTPIIINARSKTVAEIKKELKTKLDAEYYQNATVVLKLVESHQRPGKVFITGTLKGQVALLPSEPKTVMQAIVELGGDTEYANLKKVKLYRLNRTTNKEDITIIDIGAMLKGKSRQDDKVLQDGDRIFVPEKGIIFN